ncbi:hypothetical protein [Natronincola ferrireducens]|uniref:Uncharacterized protein n=1 Tax=Natronincola ferrireducens TaxID=393762 RepID=A0A1G8ZXI5_9FIRM|nr:hypothetical protein [Natronincola ferrireducens]SDK19808.1 hypothetical protein SAMN05660472_00997 [Natronincola ferrireducens]
MERRKNYVWKKKGFLGHIILHSSKKQENYKIHFLGAEELGENNYKVHLMYCYKIGSPQSGIGLCSVNMSINIEIGEKVRFEGFFGIIEELVVEYKEEDCRCYNKFFPIKHIKFLSIQKDYIEYEVHSY